MILSIKRNGLILGAFALATTGIIALTHLLTSGLIQSQEKQQLQAILASIVPVRLHDNAIEHDCVQVSDPQLGDRQSRTIYRATLSGEPAALAISAVAPNGYNGNIELLVGMEVSGHISGVRALKHQETPGLGDKIELRISDWIQGFDGLQYDPQNSASWAVKKDGGQFDQFTGATITPRAVVSAVGQALEFAMANQEQLFAAPNACASGESNE
ncbi:electron transport complex subunit RsxG [Aliiglaciecola sp. CAU 1673]|uniref:electron transport complex subunit RsxG n=1 Tax=Aliiglaciecola sp. CAU 1673 TaxID=3032595 RepID=UPI0023DB3092|nr:electron transport complex subunit RsxG [Aliiglaciecola sp. CAU 1673]MDF2179318.1 electron transport complex subunit RsxG [Aliiglaciecola sp. CAU 1673]